MSNGFIVPTGKIIKEYINSTELSQKEVAQRLGMSEKHISNVLNGNNNVTAEFALKLEKLFSEIPASYWLNYESKYQEYKARENEKYHLQSANLREVSAKYHFEEVFKDVDLSLEEQAIEMLKLLKISDFSNFDIAYEKLESNLMEDSGTKEGVVVWLKLCESEITIQNKDLSQTEYKQKLLVDNIARFKALANSSDTENSISKCRELCNELGINLVVQGTIVDTNLRSALFFSSGHPTICLNGKFSNHVYIWLDFIHELGHLILHNRPKEVFLNAHGEKANKSMVEKEADEYAENVFLNPKDYDFFIKNINPTKEAITRFAKSQKVLPEMVVFRLKQDNIIELNEFLYI